MFHYALLLLFLVYSRVDDGRILCTGSDEMDALHGA